MAKTKPTIIDMTPQELLKIFVASVGELIKAENETLKTVLMAEIKAVGEDVKRSERKLDSKIDDHEKRIGQVEDQLGIHKN